MKKSLYHSFNMQALRPAGIRSFTWILQAHQLAVMKNGKF